MNLLLGFVLLIGSTVLGFAFRGGLKKTLRFNQDFYNFLKSLESNCAFRQDTIKVLLASQKECYGADFNAFLAELEKNLDNKEFLAQWQGEQKVTSPDVAREIANFLNSFGKLDCEAQINAIKDTRNNFEILLDKSRQKENIASPIYSKLGIICGIALFIIVL